MQPKTRKQADDMILLILDNVVITYMSEKEKNSSPLDLKFTAPSECEIFSGGLRVAYHPSALSSAKQRQGENKI